MPGRKIKLTKLRISTLQTDDNSFSMLVRDSIREWLSLCSNRIIYLCMARKEVNLVGRSAAVRLNSIANMWLSKEFWKTFCTTGPSFSWSLLDIYWGTRLTLWGLMQEATTTNCDEWQQGCFWEHVTKSTWLSAADRNVWLDHNVTACLNFKHQVEIYHKSGMYLPYALPGPEGNHV